MCLLASSILNFACTCFKVCEYPAYEDDGDHAKRVQ